MAALLDLRECTVQFGGLTAVNALSLEIGPNDLVGLIGPNGAGKTTVFNIITGIYRPTAGSITLAGQSIIGRKPFAAGIFPMATSAGSRSCVRSPPDRNFYCSTNRLRE